MAIFRQGPPRGGVEFRWGRLKSQRISRFATDNCCTVVSLLHSTPSTARFLLTAGQRNKQSRSPMTLQRESARPCLVGLMLYTFTLVLTFVFMVVRELCVWQQGSTLRWRQLDRIELYALVNPKPKSLIIKKLRSRYCTIEANYWQTWSIVRPLCDSRATNREQATDFTDSLEASCKTCIQLAFSSSESAPNW